jgi:hypothetical protein
MVEEERDEWTKTVRVFGASGGRAATSDKHERDEWTKTVRVFGASGVEPAG